MNKAALILLFCSGLALAGQPKKAKKVWAVPTATPEQKANGIGPDHWCTQITLGAKKKDKGGAPLVCKMVKGAPAWVSP